MVTEYVPEGVAGGGVGATPAPEGDPEPPQARANIIITARQIRRFRLCLFMPNARIPVPSNSPNAKTKSLESLLWKAVNGAVVVIVTVKGVAFTPMFTMGVDTVQVAAVGTPQQMRVAVPV